MKRISLLAAILCSLTNCVTKQNGTRDVPSLDRGKKALVSQFGSDLGGYFFCQLNDKEDKCKQSGCFWDPGGFCLSATTSECNSATNSRTCENIGCKWTKYGKCSTSQFILVCDEYGSRDSCKSSGCVWDNRNNSCLSQIFSSCSSAREKESCSDLGCIFDEKSGRCQSGTFSACSSFESPGSCKEADCKWRLKSNSCHSKHTVFSENSSDLGCYKIRELNECQKEGRCVWGVSSSSNVEACIPLSEWGMIDISKCVQSGCSALRESYKNLGLESFPFPKKEVLAGKIEKSVLIKNEEVPNLQSYKSIIMTLTEMAFRYAMQSDFQTTISLIESGALINALDSEGNPLFFYAFRNGTFDEMKKLLSLGANLELPDSKGGTIFEWALSNHSEAAVCRSIAMLISNGLNFPKPLIEKVPTDCRTRILEISNKILAASTFFNKSEGGCGGFAALICDTRLGLRNGPIDQQEWDDTYNALKTLEGRTTIWSVLRRYSKKGFCTFSDIRYFEGTLDNLKTIRSRLDRGCQAQLFMTSAHQGHVEAVLDVAIDENKPSGAIITNSWGRAARIEAWNVGDASGTTFYHPYFGLYPLNDVSSFLNYICPCSKLTWGEYIKSIGYWSLLGTIGEFLEGMKDLDRTSTLVRGKSL